VVSLVRVDESRREVLRALLSDYLTELAANEGAAGDGPPVYGWFDLYWSDPGRVPFFIEAGGAVVGFCLIRVMDDGWNIAEFGIRPDSRRTGLGSEAVRALSVAASTFGATHLRADVHAWNHGALEFWTSCGFVPVVASSGVVSTRLTL
jgi:ribosomal protein S18 acetylase RimI-like enzyme